jgi:phosphatidylinositol N-acetylglucosaminyltransferase subunit Q
MPDHDGLMRIFWPTDISRADVPGVVVGWRNSDLDVFVVAVLEHVEVRASPLQLGIGASG